MIWLYVALGSAAGGCLRHLLGTAMQGWLDQPAFPWGTWLVNVLGCLAIGAVMPLVDRGSPAQMVVVVGLLGGFTTFSAFSWQAVELLAAGQAPTALAYIVASLVACLLATAGGWWLVRLVHPQV
jgi:CrcB protein